MSTQKTENKKPVESAPGIKQSERNVSVFSTKSELYRKHEKVRPKRVKGTFRRLKWIALFTLLGIYYLVPFIPWQRGPGIPNQAVMVDFEHSRLYFFFIEIWPQEIYYLTGLLILAAIGLFLVTALFGRVWCGYACPQTVWTDLFVAVERFFEGDRNARIKLDKSPWNANKIMKRVAKHATWLVIAAATGGAWILYFHDARALIVDLFIGKAPMSAYLFLGIMTFTTYSLAGFMREQVCTFMCPWPRIQAAMLDNESLNVDYRKDRGEPRGPHKKGATWEGRGDCIDCRQCIAVCPTGIDIRNGLQLECIGCALCIDACDAVMEKIGRPKGLIAYDTDANIERRLKGETPRFRFVRARTVIYSAILVAIGSLMLYGLMNRTTLELNVQRDRSPNFVTLSDGGVRNGYTLKILNKTDQDRFYTVEAIGLEKGSIDIVGLQKQDGKFRMFVGAGKPLDYRVYVKLDDVSGLETRIPFTFRITDTDAETQTDKTKETDTLFITGKDN